MSQMIKSHYGELGQKKKLLSEVKCFIPFEPSEAIQDICTWLGYRTQNLLCKIDGGA